MSAPSHCPQPSACRPHRPGLADPGLRLGLHVRGEEDHGQVQHDGHPQTDPRQHVGHPPWAVDIGAWNGMKAWKVKGKKYSNI